MHTSIRRKAPRELVWQLNVMTETVWPLGPTCIFHFRIPVNQSKLKLEEAHPMEQSAASQIQPCHVVAIPYPGRGHINPIMNICEHLSSRKPDILITVILTEEWHGLISADPKAENIRFATIPNVVPSERGRGKDFPGFVQSVSTNMGAPVEEALDRIQPPVTVIIADTHLIWAVGVGRRRGIPVASFWPMSATVFSILYHFHLLQINGHFPANLLEKGEDVVDYIPGVSPSKVLDLPTANVHYQVLRIALDGISMVSKAQFLLLSSVHELEAEVIQHLNYFSFHIYSLGPTIPFHKHSSHSSIVNDDDENFPSYIKWLDLQSEHSVLYISMGSFLSVSNAQMEEIVRGVLDSNVHFLWVSRGEIDFKGKLHDKGVVVPWCDQLKVLHHPSIGGFWTHCGWNSTMEGLFCGVPMLTYPITWDQFPNAKVIVEDWKIGWRVSRKVGSEDLVSHEEIKERVQDFMDSGNDDMIKMREQARKLRAICVKAISIHGSSNANFQCFINEISKYHAK